MGIKWNELSPTLHWCPFLVISLKAEMTCVTLCSPRTSVVLGCTSGAHKVWSNKYMGAEEEKEGTDAFTVLFRNGSVREMHADPLCAGLTALCLPHPSEEGERPGTENKARQIRSTPDPVPIARNPDV